MDISLITAATLFLQAASEETGLDGWTRSREALVADYRAACSGGVALACGAAERPLDLAAVKQEAIAACAHRDAAACVVAAWAEAGGTLSGVTATFEAEERAQAACAQGRAGACVVAARLAGPRPQGDADPHEAAACELGVVSACLDLPVVPYEAAQILAWCHGGAVDACLRVRSDLPWIGMLLGGGAAWAMIAVDEGGDDARLAPYAEACRRKDLLACTVHGDVLVHQGYHREGISLLAETCRQGEVGSCRLVVGSLELGYLTTSSRGETRAIRARIAEDDARAKAEPTYPSATTLGVPAPHRWPRAKGGLELLVRGTPIAPSFLPPGEWRCVARIEVTPEGKPDTVYFPDCEPYLRASVYRDTRDMRFTVTAEGGWFDYRAVYRIH